MKPSEAARRQKLFAASKTRYPSDLSSTRSCSSAWPNWKKPPAGLIPAPRQTCEGGPGWRERRQRGISKWPARNQEAQSKPPAYAGLRNLGREERQGIASVELGSRAPRKCQALLAGNDAAGRRAPLDARLGHMAGRYLLLYDLRGIAKGAKPCGEPAVCRQPRTRERSGDPGRRR